MIRRIISELRIRRAWSVIEQAKRDRVKRERRVVHVTAQRLRLECGLPPDKRLAS